MLETRSAVCENLLSLIRCKYSTPVTQTRCSPLHAIQSALFVTTTSHNGDAHVCKTMGDVYKDIGLFFGSVGVVNAGGIDDDNAFSVNRSFDNADIAGTGLKTLADFLVLRRDEIRELFWKQRR